MHRAQGLVAFLDGADNDAEGHLVVDPLQRDALGHQLLVDGIDVLGPAEEPHRHNLAGLEFFAQDLQNLVNVGLAFGKGAFQMGGQFSVFHRQ